MRRTPYHPEANGIVERFHRQIKTVVKYQKTERWVEVLPKIILGIQTTYKEDLKATLTEMVQGKQICLQRELNAFYYIIKTIINIFISYYSSHSSFKK